MPPSCDLSVVVCTFDRYDDLQICLSALSPETQMDSPNYEVLVIDQTPSDRRRKLSHPYISQIFQDEIGLSVARNLGIKNAAFDLVAFLDDDAVPCVSWVTAMSDAFAGPERAWVRAAGGRVEADWRHGSRPVWMTPVLEQYLSCVDWSHDERPLQEGEWIVGANMVFRKSIFSEIGLFDTALGRKGNSTLLSNEEIAIINKIGRGNILYVPKAQARHIIQPSRFHQTWFRKRVYWQAISDLLANSVWLSVQEAHERIAKFMLHCPAELRSLRAFFRDFSDPQLMDLQLKAIYSFVILGADGFHLNEGH
jgi:glucosyl-dolichyl phosphate glucuronosyltransferase